MEAEVELAGGVVGRASVPAGASTGRHEAVDLRDGDARHWRGLGVSRAVRHVAEEIAPVLAGVAADDQRAVDERLVELDGTGDRGRLGANALLAVSLACARGAARATGVPLWRWLAREQPPVIPLPMVNLLSGGLHASGSIDLQDILVIPAGARDYPSALEVVCAVHAAAHDLLRARGMSTLRADEGGYGPSLASNEEALRLAVASIEHAGYTPGTDVVLAIDLAASHFRDAASGRYRLACEGRELAADELVGLVAEWATAYPLVSVEDVLGEDDWDGWVAATTTLGDGLQIVGDDLFTTHPQRLARGVALGAANAVLVKMNQIGTLTETLDVVAAAHDAGYATVVSARSGETEDDALADLAVASGSGQIKVGSVTGSERLAKYNRLLRISERADAPRYAGAGALAGARS